MTSEIREEIYQREDRTEKRRKEAERQVEKDLTRDELFVF